MSELQKEPLPPRPRMQPCALLTSQLNARRTPGFEELFTLTFCSKVRCLGFSYRATMRSYAIALLLERLSGHHHLRHLRRPAEKNRR
jgi:hypothetical protein